GLYRDRLAPGFADTGHHRVCRLLALDVVDDHLGPIAGEALGNRLADAARTAGDDGDLVLELHDGALLRSVHRLRTRADRRNREGAPAMPQLPRARLKAAVKSSKEAAPGSSSPPMMKAGVPWIFSLSARR